MPASAKNGFPFSTDQGFKHLLQAIGYVENLISTCFKEFLRSLRQHKHLHFYYVVIRRPLMRTSLNIRQNANLRWYERMLYAVRCLKSNEDMILALAGQFKQLSHEPEKFR